jgi:hypothetical protein
MSASWRPCLGPRRWAGSTWWCWWINFMSKLRIGVLLDVRDKAIPKGRQEGGGRGIQPVHSQAALPEPRAGLLHSTPPGRAQSPGVRSGPG